MISAFILLRVAVAALLTTVNAQSPPVKVSLRSSWPAPPLLAEILETVALEKPDAFFTFLDRLTDTEALALPATTPEAIHQNALQIALNNGILQEIGSLSAVKMNLALHAATPKLEAFYNHYEDHHNHSQGSHCGSWVDWYGEVVCDAHRLAQLAGLENLDPTTDSNNSSLQTRPKILTFDHIFPPPNSIVDRPPRTAILYASLTSPNFRELHTYLLKIVNKPDPHVEYVFRHIPPTIRSDGRSFLSGYGVALDLKKMDYLALDDRHSSTYETATTHSNSVAGGQEQRVGPVLPLILAHPENSTAPDASVPLSPEELAELGVQAAQIIAESSEPLTALSHLSQNFPKYATSLARRVVANESVIRELHDNALKAPRGVNVFWFNGAQTEPKDVNPFALLRLLKKERTVVQSLTSYGLSNLQAFELLTHPAVASAQKDGGTMQAVFDASDRPEGGALIMWWNDMEKDTRYAPWNPNLLALLRPMYPGAMPSIKANLFNVILVLDLSYTSSLNFISGPMSNIINRDLPLRFGVIPQVETADGKKMARLFYYLIKTYGRKKTLAFLAPLAQLRLPPHLQTPTVNWLAVTTSYDALIAAELENDPEAPKPDLKSILEGDDDADVQATFDRIAAYTERLDATPATSPLGHAFFNGKHLEINDDFLRQLQVEATQQMNFLQGQVYEGSLSDENKGETMGNYFYDLPTTSKRRNRYIFPSDASSLNIVNLPELFAKTRLLVSSSTYIYPESDSIPLSLFIIADLDSPGGLELIKEALTSLTPGSKTRVSFIHNPSTPISLEKGARSPASWLVSHLHTKELMRHASPTSFALALGIQMNDASVATNDGAQQIPITKDEAFAKLIGGNTSDDIAPEEYADYIRASRLVVRDLHFSPGQLALVVNGRVVGPIEPGQFHAADFKALEEYEYLKRTEPIVKAIQDVAPFIANDKILSADAVAMASSVVSSSQLPDPSESGLFDAPPRPRQRSYQLLDSEYTSFELGDNSTALYRIAVLLDPLSETAQKWSSILKWLSHVPEVFIEIHLNPGQYTDIPLKRFYRYNLIHSLSYDKKGLEVPSKAIFEDIPVDAIYTLAMDVPTAWLVRPREALYDLDNIQLGKLFPGDMSVDAIFDLDYLVVEGHAREVTYNSAPRGVQVQLVTRDGTPIDDTQVVANLGYFQFKAKPGVFQLEIRQGRGRKLYRLESAGNEGWQSATVEEIGSDITLTSFEGLTLYPRLSRLPGMENEDVLEQEKSGGGDPKSVFETIISSVKSFFNSQEVASKDLVPVQQQADINIFTVASGLLYERFVGIMILSVLRNTNSTVKFWFIENFLSPSFLEFIPHMAEKYNFQYELVTYKWPSWLRAQTEKQRIIWAYKILFLDVLFPMDLKKVIFVDADQIVRADLKELVDLDLHGAPYGYTPMGDDNTDMEGFRFWKTGYWKEFLQGKPYHISALYVIDLVRFRQLAAGDILRGQYQQLSADPNSLANLDQDLPNNIQREVPIFSLHEDWLWCETWCSKDRLHRAKTIDLCQNPLTKEPKLARARQIPEWEEYDSEIARLSRDLAEQGKIHSRMATADANVLAGATNGASISHDQGTEDNVQGSAGGDKSEELKEQGLKKDDSEAMAVERDEL